MSDSRTTDLLVAFGIGMLSGAIAGLLLAPASGEETRRKIGDFGQDALERGKEGMDSAKQAASEQAKRLGEAVHEGVETVKSTAGDQARRIGQAVQEGKAAYQRETAKS